MSPDLAPGLRPPLAPAAPPAALRTVRWTDARDESGEPVAELAAARVVGPGRIERGYLERIGRLEGEATAALEIARELELARLVERGAQRRLDRVEADLRAARRAAEEARALERRMCAALGALQRENALLGEKLARRSAALLAPPRRSWLARMLARD